VQDHRAADRHSRDAPGLVPLGPDQAVKVRLVIEPAHGRSRAVQHTAWMLVNMLARLELIVDEVQIDCPRSIPLDHQVVPFVDGTRDLAEALVTAGQRIGIVPVAAADASTADHVITIGPGPAPLVGLRTHGHAWSGAISTGEIAPDARPPRSSLPFGPYVAASLATSEIFRAVRADLDRFPPPARVCYSLYSHRTNDEWFDDGPPDIPSLRIDAALAGAGAVGCAWLHTIWACSDLYGSVVVADDDADGVDVTNLNRGTLFTIEDVGEPKADVAVAAAARAGLQLTAHVGKVETAPNPSRFMVVAADTNSARAGIQSQYSFPLLFASTSDLRAEVVRCDPTRDGPCMRCHNPPRDEPSDDELADRFLAASPAEQARLAEAAETDVDSTRTWATDPTPNCGLAGERVLPALRAADRDQRALFAVPFVSVLAGAMLAAETVKELAHWSPLSALVPRAVFQFLKPLAKSNGASSYERQRDCPQCGETTPGGAVWRKRAQAANPRPD